LIAQWRATASNSDAPAKIGQARLARAGAPPRDDPATIATTLSELLAEFSRDLARAVGQSTTNSNREYSESSSRP
jgi:hypothetical protein